MTTTTPRIHDRQVTSCQNQAGTRLNVHRGGVTRAVNLLANWTGLFWGFLVALEAALGQSVDRGFYGKFQSVCDAGLVGDLFVDVKAHRDIFESRDIP